jgi:glutamate dehydrogenase (NAD(P)+)
MRVVAVADAHGGVYCEHGIDPEVLADHAGATRTVAECPGTEQIAADEVLEVPCDVLIPASVERVVTERNADRVQAWLIVEAANGPLTPKADEVLADKGILVIPDVMANAGGVVVSYFEWVQNLQHFRWDEREVNDRLGRIMRRAFREVSARASKAGVSMRVAAYELGIERVVEAATIRGYLS